jgi:group I intron endonuclease
MKTGVYTITNTIDNKVYVGYAKDIHARLRAHKYYLREGKHVNAYLQRAVDKYGLNSFKFEVLEECLYHLAPAIEHYWCNVLKTAEEEYGYNLLPTAVNGKPTYLRESTRMKLSASHKGHKRSPEAQAKISAAQFKPICQIDLAGNIVATYQSLQEAVKATGVYSPGISMCLNGTMQRTGGYYWCLESNIESFTRPAPRSQRYPTKTILQCDLDGVVIKEWPSITEIVKHFGVSNSLMTAKLKSNKPYKNYIWKYQNSVNAST